MNEQSNEYDYARECRRCQQHLDVFSVNFSFSLSLSLVLSLSSYNLIYIDEWELYAQIYFRHQNIEMGKSKCFSSVLLPFIRWHLCGAHAFLVVTRTNGWAM